MRWSDPTYRSLTQPVLWGGVPRSLFLGNVCLGLSLASLLNNFLLLAMFVPMHFLMRWLTKRDPQWHEVIGNHLKRSGYYDV